MSVVLIVDDHADSSRALQRLIELLGATVHCAAGGVQALSYLAERPPPSLVVLDIAMPGMDGIETLRRIREIAGPARDVRVVLNTAHPRSVYGAVGAELGVTEYWEKGRIEGAEIVARLERLVQLRGTDA